MSEVNKPAEPGPARNQKPETRNLIEVSAGLVFRDGQLLITQRHAGAHLGGLWEFPGGKREPHETFAECLVRELREELGIEIIPGQILESLTHDYPEKSVHLKFFHCRWQSGEPRALGCADWKWIGADELDQHQFPAADARLLARLKSTPEWWRPAP